MKFILLSIIILISIYYIFNYLIHQKKKTTYKKASKKWDGIVEELRRRK
tara:strand:+ start:612 stop:758 length:147 start_codon:yes stop_codon:yes gene_type:complete